jgi:metal-sulfur cluster biosynthetic enzyme
VNGFRFLFVRPVERRRNAFFLGGFSLADHNDRRRTSGRAGAPGDARVRCREKSMMEQRQELINPAPVVHRKSPSIRSAQIVSREKHECDEALADPFDAQEVFEHIKDINDPEHPYSLEQLDVVSAENVDVRDAEDRIKVAFTPTVPHCSMATLIGLSIRVKLLRVLPRRFKVDIVVSPGSHSSEAAVNKQLNDKERVAAALENPNLLEKVDLCLSGQTAM